MSRTRCFALLSCWLLLASTSNVFGIELLYTFEGDSGTTVTDKLTSDGAQDGVIYQNVDPADTTVTMFGTQSAFFDMPVTLNPPRVSVVQIPDSVFPPDFNMTLAAWANQSADVNRLTRLFSTFVGTGATTDQLILDFSTAPADRYVRAIFDGKTYRTPTTAVPSGLETPGYHHYAVTVNAGEVKLYFDGTQVMTENTETLHAGYNYLHNIQIGEDRGNLANEQLIGNVDEALVLQRALSAADIALLASGMPVSSVVTPVAEERSVYYDFEGDSGTTFTDKFTLDGGQDGIAQLDAIVDENPANARLGNNSLALDDPLVPAPVQHSVISAGQVGALGTKFTLSATVNALAGGQNSGNLARVFSSYSGSGGTAGRLLFDFNPNAVLGGTGTNGIGVRIVLPNGISLISDIAPALLENQTLTAVYDLGELTLYLNGNEIATRTDYPGLITLGTFELRIGEDLGGNVNEQFVGNMDDVLILSRALTPQQVSDLHTMGAEALIASLPEIEETIAGDYNGDNVIDAADYVLWRDTLGATGAGLAADGSGNEVVDVADHFLWKTNFGTTLTPPSETAAVPEPSALALVAGTLLGAMVVGRRFRSN